MDLDPLILSRIQFAFVVSFHAIFPVFTIGLAAYIAVLEGLLLKTENPVWEQLARFWTKVFAVVFGMGVVSGIVMSFQFGTNWSNFAYASANFFGPMLSYEVVTAFFLEAGFLGVMLFGMNRVGRGLHFLATLMVAIGTFVSAFWILSANSWMQTPTGFEIGANGQFLPGESWWAIVFNPSFPYRLAHMVNAAYITTGFVVLAVGARYLLAESFQSLTEIARAVAAAEPRAKVPRVMPLPVARAVSAAGEGVARVTGRPPMIPRSGLQFLERGSRPSGARARSELGWSPTPFATGVEHTLAYFRRQGWT